VFKRFLECFVVAKDSKYFGEARGEIAFALLEKEMKFESNPLVFKERARGFLL